MKIYALNDNRKINGFESEHGFSILIEKGNFRLLFDAGETDLFMRNAKRLSLDLTKTNAIVLSHGDYDHANGLKFLKLKDKISVYAHPSIFDYRISKRRSVYAGINQTKGEIEENFNLVLSKEPIEIYKDIFFLGEIERQNKGEINLPMIKEDGSDFLHLDDTGLAIKTEKGLVIISGCAHSGICNTIAHAVFVTGEKRVHAVLGGFHLKDVDEKLNYTIDFLNKTKVENVILAHCTSERCILEFEKRLTAKTQVFGAGKVFEF